MKYEIYILFLINFRYPTCDKKKNWDWPILLFILNESKHVFSAVAQCVAFGL